MDVSPFKFRAFLCVFGIGLLLVSCGNRYDLTTERGRQSRIDEANFQLSQGNCGAALEAIGYLYNSAYVDDEVRIITASAYACQGSFNMLTLVGSLPGAPNFLSAVAKSLTNCAGDGARNAFYQASDILTTNKTLLNANQRSRAVNTYMVFIQMGIIGVNLRNYGNPGTDGSQGTALVYDGHGGSPAGEMSNVDACALSASLANISDSFGNSSLTDGDTAAFNNSMNSICVSAGLTSCADLNKSRSACDGSNTDSQAAEAVVNAVNSAW